MKQKLLTVILILLFGVFFTACKNEGPAEKAGKQIDEAAEQTADTAGDAMEKATDAAKDAGDAIKEKAGEAGE